MGSIQLNSTCFSSNKNKTEDTIISFCYNTTRMCNIIQLNFNINKNIQIIRSCIIQLIILSFLELLNIIQFTIWNVKL